MKSKNNVANVKAKAALTKMPKILVSLVTIGLVWSSSALISLAATVLMESDRVLEYNYAWSGHKPHIGERESFQIASRELLDKLNHMANVSQFDSFAGTNVEQTLQNQFENIGKLIRNTTRFERRSKSEMEASYIQRGLVLSIETLRFKPGSYYNFSEQDPLTLKRNSKAGGTLQYKFVVYGPTDSKIVSKDASSSSAEQGEQIAKSISARRVGGGNWANSPAMTSIGNTLYIIQDTRSGHTLYQVNPGRGAENAAQVGTAGTWDNTQLMTSAGGKLYMIQDTRLFELDPNNPKNARRVGSGNWANSSAMTSIGNTLYIIQDTRSGHTLYQVNPGRGAENAAQVGTAGTWDNTQLMTSAGGKLYMIQDTRLFELAL